MKLSLKKICLASLLLGGLVVTVLIRNIEPPVPTGPAAEAPTGAIEITMDAAIPTVGPTMLQE
jgi:hypothetical protein